MFKRNKIPIRYEDLIMLFKIIDQNNDGMLQFDEFKQIVFNDWVQKSKIR